MANATTATETLTDLAAVLGDEAFAEYRAITKRRGDPVGHFMYGQWRCTRAAAEQDARDFARQGEKLIRIQRQVAP